MTKRNAKAAVSTRRKYVVDWRIEGSYEVMASSPEEAQDLFDKAWETPSRVSFQDGEVSNDVPYLNSLERDKEW